MDDEFCSNTEHSLQEELNCLRKQWTSVIDKKEIKQIEKNIEDTALKLAKLKISKNAQFERNTLYKDAVDPPLPTKELTTSNLELFALNEEANEKTEHGLHKKLEFMHSKSPHNNHATDMDAITDDTPNIDELSQSDSSTLSSDLSSGSCNDNSVVERVQTQRRHSLPTEPKEDNNQYTLQHFSPPRD
eukprot:278497_1